MFVASLAGWLCCAYSLVMHPLFVLDARVSAHIRTHGERISRIEWLKRWWHGVHIQKGYAKRRQQKSEKRGREASQERHPTKAKEEKEKKTTTPSSKKKNLTAVMPERE